MKSNVIDFESHPIVRKARTDDLELMMRIVMNDPGRKKRVEQLRRRDARLANRRK